MQKHNPIAKELEGLLEDLRKKEKEVDNMVDEIIGVVAGIKTLSPNHEHLMKVLREIEHHMYKMTHEPEYDNSSGFDSVLEDTVKKMFAKRFRKYERHERCGRIKTFILGEEY